MLASRLIKVDDLTSRPSRVSYILTDTGISLSAAAATKRFGRPRADKAIARLLEVVAEINDDPVYLHDIIWVAVFGSYLEDVPDLGDIDTAKGR